MPCVKFVETAKETFMSKYSFLNKLHPRLGTVAKIWSSRKATRRLIEDIQYAHLILKENYQSNYVLG